MVELIYSHPQGHFERHEGEDIVLSTNGQVLVGDGVGRRCYLEWSAVEGMFSSLISGAEAVDVEVVAQGHGRLEVHAGSRLIAEDAGFQLRPTPMDGAGVQLLDAAGAERAILRAGSWWLPGERLISLTVVPVGVEIVLPDIISPGPRSRVSGLAERALLT